MPLSFLSALRSISFDTLDFVSVLGSKLAVDIQKNKKYLQYFVQYVIYFVEKHFGNKMSPIASLFKVAKLYHVFNQSYKLELDKQALTKAVFLTLSKFELQNDKDLLREITYMPGLHTFLENEIQQAKKVPFQGSENLEINCFLYKSNTIIVNLFQTLMKSTNLSRDETESIPIISINTYSQSQLFGSFFQTSIENTHTSLASIFSMLNNLESNLKSEEVYIFGWPANMEAEMQLLELVLKKMLPLKINIVCPFLNFRRTRPLSHRVNVSFVPVYESKVNFKESSFLNLFNDLLQSWKRTSDLCVTRAECHRNNLFKTLFFSLAKKTMDSLFYCFLITYGMDNVTFENKNELETLIRKDISSKFSLCCNWDTSLETQTFSFETDSWEERTIFMSYCNKAKTIISCKQPLLVLGHGFHKLVLSSMLKTNYNLKDTVQLTSKDFYNFFLNATSNFIDQIQLIEGDNNVCYFENNKTVFVVDYSTCTLSELSFLRDLLTGLPIYMKRFNMRGKMMKMFKLIVFTSVDIYKSYLQSCKEDVFNRFYILRILEPRSKKSFFFQAQQIQHDQKKLDICQKISDNIDKMNSKDEIETMDINSAVTFRSILLKAHFESFEMNLISHFLFPLQDNVLKECVLNLLSQTVNKEAVSRYLANKDALIDFCLEKTKKSITLLGEDQYFHLEKTCQALNFKYNFYDFLTLSNVKENNDPNTITIISIKEPTPNFGDMLQKQLENGRVVVILSHKLFCSLTKPFVDFLKNQTLLVNVPPMSSFLQDENVVRNIPEAIKVIIKSTHSNIIKICNENGFKKPTNALLNLVQVTCLDFIETAKRKMQENVKRLEKKLERLEKYNDHVNCLKQQRKQVINAISEYKKEKSISDVTQKEYNTFLEESISQITFSNETYFDLKEQLINLETEKNVLIQKAFQKLEKSRLQVKETLKEEEINSILANHQILQTEIAHLVGAVLAAILDSIVPTDKEDMVIAARLSQLKQTDRFHFFLLFNPMELTQPISLFLQNQVRSLENISNKIQDSMPIQIQVLCNYFEGISEVLSFKDDILELNVKIQECQLQLNDKEEKKVEMLAQEKNQVDKITNLQKNAISIFENLEKMQSQERTLELSIARATNVIESFKPIVDIWEEELRSLKRSENLIEYDETFKAIVHCYLAGIPQGCRDYVLAELKLNLADAPVSSEKKCDVDNVWTPWNFQNLLFGNNIPGWKQGFALKLAVVLDPHDIVCKILQSDKNKKVICVHLVTFEDKKNLLNLYTSALDDKTFRDVLVVVSQIQKKDLHWISNALSHCSNLAISTIVIITSSTFFPHIPTDSFFIDFSLNPIDAAQMLRSLYADEKTKQALFSELRSAENKKLKGITNNLEKIVMLLNPSNSPEPNDIEEIAKDLKELSHNCKSKLHYQTEKNISIDIPCAIYSASVRLSEILKCFQISVTSFLDCIKDDTDFKACFNFVAYQYSEQHSLCLRFLCSLYFSIHSKQISKEEGNLVQKIFHDVYTNCAQNKSPDNLVNNLSNISFGKQSLTEIYNKNKTQNVNEASLLDPINGNIWERLIVSIILKPNKCSNIICAFLEEKSNTGNEPFFNWNTTLICFEEILNIKNTSKKVQNPVILYMESPAYSHEDPTLEIKYLSSEIGLTPSKLKFLAVTPTMCIYTLTKCLGTAMVRGHWLVLTNVELNFLVVSQCYKVLDTFEKQLHK